MEGLVDPLGMQDQADRQQRVHLQYQGNHFRTVVVYYSNIFQLVSVLTTSNKISSVDLDDRMDLTFEKEKKVKKMNKGKGENCIETGFFPQSCIIWVFHLTFVRRGLRNAEYTG